MSHDEKTTSARYSKKGKEVGGDIELGIIISARPRDKLHGWLMSSSEMFFFGCFKHVLTDGFKMLNQVEAQFLVAKYRLIIVHLLMMMMMIVSEEQRPGWTEHVLTIEWLELYRDRL